MTSLVQTLKRHNLLEMYLAMPVEHKKAWEKYFPRSCNCDGCISGSSKPFPVKSASRLLWVTAANAIPHYNYEFAETLLNKALEYNNSQDDSIWIHANLLQIYYDQLETSPGASDKCREHCRQLIQMGFDTPWVKRLMEQLGM